MVLTFLPPPPPPTAAQLFARVEDLPFGMAGLVRGALKQPGTTTDHLLYLADAMDEARADIAVVFPGGSQDADVFAAAAGILRDAAPLYPHPARLPAAPIDPNDTTDYARLRARA
jgi:hypothetical protein